MITCFQTKRSVVVRKILSIIVATAFIINFILPAGMAHAQLQVQSVLNLPLPGSMLMRTPSFNPPMIQGLTVDPINPLAFDFMINSGDVLLNSEELKLESTQMVKYFLASLTTPEDEMWVNLSPFEKDRMIPDSFGDTEMGRDLLAQDYLLKQLTASLNYPEDELGKKFWNNVYAKARSLFGNTEISINSFNKVWIVPEKAVVFEQGGSAYVLESRLKVMLEEDYVDERESRLSLASSISAQDKELSRATRDQRRATTDLVRKILIPEIEREVNEGKTFANLRQIYNAMILASWYKENLKESLLGQIYVDQNKTKGVNTEDPTVNQKIYDQYIEAYRKGVYNYIKEDIDPATKDVIPRKYFSGGISAASPLFGHLKDVTKTYRSTSDLHKLSEDGFIAYLEVLGWANIEWKEEQDIENTFKGFSTYERISISRAVRGMNNGMHKVRFLLEEENEIAPREEKAKVLTSSSALEGKYFFVQQEVYPYFSKIRAILLGEEGVEFEVSDEEYRQFIEELLNDNFMFIERQKKYLWHLGALLGNPDYGINRLALNVDSASIDNLKGIAQTKLKEMTNILSQKGVPDFENKVEALYIMSYSALNYLFATDDASLAEVSVIGLATRAQLDEAMNSHNRYSIIVNELGEDLDNELNSELVEHINQRISKYLPFTEEETVKFVDAYDSQIQISVRAKLVAVNELIENLRNLGIEFAERLRGVDGRTVVVDTENMLDVMYEDLRQNQPNDMKHYYKEEQAQKDLDTDLVYRQMKWTLSNGKDVLIQPYNEPQINDSEGFIKLMNEFLDNSARTDIFDQIIGRMTREKELIAHNRRILAIIKKSIKDSEGGIKFIGLNKMEEEYIKDQEIVKSNLQLFLQLMKQGGIDDPENMALDLYFMFNNPIQFMVAANDPDIFNLTVEPVGYTSNWKEMVSFEIHRGKLQGALKQLLSDDPVLEEFFQYLILIEQGLLIPESEEVENEISKFIEISEALARELIVMTVEYIKQRRKGVEETRKNLERLNQSGLVLLPEYLFKDIKIMNQPSAGSPMSAVNFREHFEESFSQEISSGQLVIEDVPPEAFGFPLGLDDAEIKALKLRINEIVSEALNVLGESDLLTIDFKKGVRSKLDILFSVKSEQEEKLERIIKLIEPEGVGQALLSNREERLGILPTISVKGDYITFQVEIFGLEERLDHYGRTEQPVDIKLSGRSEPIKGAKIVFHELSEDGQIEKNILRVPRFDSDPVLESYYAKEEEDVQSSGNFARSIKHFGVEIQSIKVSSFATTHSTGSPLAMTEDALEELVAEETPVDITIMVDGEPRVIENVTIDSYEFGTDGQLLEVEGRDDLSNPVLLTMRSKERIPKEEIRYLEKYGTLLTGIDFVEIQKTEVIDTLTMSGTEFAVAASSVLNDSATTDELYSRREIQFEDLEISDDLLLKLTDSEIRLAIHAAKGWDYKIVAKKMGLTTASVGTLFSKIRIEIGLQKGERGTAQRLKNLGFKSELEPSAYLKLAMKKKALLRLPAAMRDLENEEILSWVKTILKNGDYTIFEKKLLEGVTFLELSNYFRNDAVGEGYAESTPWVMKKIESEAAQQFGDMGTNVIRKQIQTTSSASLNDPAPTNQKRGQIDKKIEEDLQLDVILNSLLVNDNLIERKLSFEVLEGYLRGESQKGKWLIKDDLNSEMFVFGLKGEESTAGARFNILKLKKYYNVHKSEARIKAEYFQMKGRFISVDLNNIKRPIFGIEGNEAEQYLNSINTRRSHDGSGVLEDEIVQLLKVNPFVKVTKTDKTAAPGYEAVNVAFFNPYGDLMFERVVMREVPSSSLVFKDVFKEMHGKDSPLSKMDYRLLEHLVEILDASDVFNIEDFSLERFIKDVSGYYVLGTMMHTGSSAKLLISKMKETGSKSLVLKVEEEFLSKREALEDELQIQIRTRQEILDDGPGVDPHYGEFFGEHFTAFLRFAQEKEQAQLSHSSQWIGESQFVTNVGIKQERGEQKASLAVFSNDQHVRVERKNLGSRDEIDTDTDVTIEVPNVPTSGVFPIVRKVKLGVARAFKEYDVKDIDVFEFTVNSDLFDKIVNDLGLGEVKGDKVLIKTYDLQHGLEDGLIVFVKYSSSPMPKGKSDLLPMQPTTLSPKGGIDFDRSLLDLQILRDPRGVPLPLPQQPIMEMKIDGLFPVFINAVPVVNAPFLISLFKDKAAIDYGQAEQDSSEESAPGNLSFYDRREMYAIREL